MKDENTAMARNHCHSQHEAETGRLYITVLPL